MARQAITLAGAFIGTALGFPQAGFFIGSIVGGLVDPEIIKAPSIGDISQQTSSEGVPCPLYAGTAGGAGNLVYASAPDIVDGGTSSGKGGPQQEEPDRAYVTFAVRIGASLFDGPGTRLGITSLIKVWEDEKLVYDVSPTTVIAAESAEYAEGFTFYPGDETQLPDPDVEAIEGVGNVPAYRGRAIFVKKRHDVTDRRGSLPSYRFEVSVNGSSEVSATWFAGPVLVATIPTHYVKADTVPDLLTATPTLLPVEGSGVLQRISVANGRVFFHRSTTACVSADRGATWTACNNSLWGGAWPQDVYWNGTGYYYGAVTSTDGITWAAIPNLPANGRVQNARDSDGMVLVQDNNGVFYTSVDAGATWQTKADLGFGYTARVATDGATYTYVSSGNFHYYSTDDLATSLNPVSQNNLTFGNWYSNGAWYLIRFQSGDGISAAYGILRSTAPAVWPNGLVTANYTFIQNGVDLDPNLMAFDGQGTCVAREQDGGNCHVYVSSDNGVTWALEGTLVAPIASFACVPGAGGTIVTPGTTTFEQVTLATGRRCKVPNASWNLPGLDAKLIRGCVVASQNYTAQDFINSLRIVFPSDGSCHDGLIHINLRGGAVDAELDEEFMVDEQDDGEQDETLRNGDDKRKAPIRRPYKINLMFPNAKVGYNLTKATSPNYGDRGDAVSETTLEIPVVLDETTEAPQLADVLDKIGRNEALGELVRVFPEGESAKLVPGSIVRLTAGDLVRRLRVATTRAGDGTRRLNLLVDSVHSYTSQAISQPGQEWPTPPASLVGTTNFALMNLPALTDAQDVTGIHVALCGNPGSAWRGAGIEYRIDGTTTWTSVGNFTRRAIIGELIDAVPAASEFYTDTTNPVRVLLIGDDAIETLTDLEWLSEGNPAAIVYPDGTAEVFQPRDAQDDGAREWTLKTHQRGRLATVPGPHLAGAQFVMLEGSSFIPLPTALIGQTLEFRFTSIGASPETAPTATIVWDPVLSQTEFQPVDVQITRALGVISGTWIPRHRFGTDVNPIASVNFNGWRVTITDGTTTQTFTATSPEFSVSDASFSGNVTVSVESINRLTTDVAPSPPVVPPVVPPGPVFTLTNADFEAGATGWAGLSTNSGTFTIINDPAEAYEGSWCGEFVGDMADPDPQYIFNTLRPEQEANGVAFMRIRFADIGSTISRAVEARVCVQVVDAADNVVRETLGSALTTNSQTNGLYFQWTSNNAVAYVTPGENETVRVGVRIRSIFAPTSTGSYTCYIDSAGFVYGI